MDTEVQEKLVSLLTQAAISYYVLEHAPAGQTEFASRIRGHALCEAAKSMVLEGAAGSLRVYALAVIPGNAKVDFSLAATLMRADRVQLAPPTIAGKLTGCEMGAVPPFSFHEDLVVFVDTRIAEQERMVFNAGRLDRSIVMRTTDYLDLLKPKLVSISARRWN